MKGSALVPHIIIDSMDKVSAFLQELKQVLCSKEFDCEKDLDILLSKKTDPDNAGYTTVETMAALGYKNKDVYNELILLTEQDYCNTVIDDVDPTLPKFFAFGKTIQNSEVYIKVKIRDRIKGKVFCVSFHFAKYPLKKPYIII